MLGNETKEATITTGTNRQINVVRSRLNEYQSEIQRNSETMADLQKKIETLRERQTYLKQEASRLDERLKWLISFQRKESTEE